ncbi:MAG: PH domain-containing protein [Candidatus Dojkabacteria bacterium]|nr:PH domain-containing protein [Candidatus Dojkabacteria bacterium]
MLRKQKPSFLYFLLHDIDTFIVNTIINVNNFIGFILGLLIVSLYIGSIVGTVFYEFISFVPFLFLIALGIYLLFKITISLYNYLTTTYYIDLENRKIEIVYDIIVSKNIFPINIEEIQSITKIIAPTQKFISNTTSYLVEISGLENPVSFPGIHNGSPLHLILENHFQKEADSPNIITIKKYPIEFWLVTPMIIFGFTLLYIITRLIFVFTLGLNPFAFNIIDFIGIVLILISLVIAYLHYYLSYEKYFVTLTNSQIIIFNDTRIYTFIEKVFLSRVADIQTSQSFKEYMLGTHTLAINSIGRLDTIKISELKDNIDEFINLASAQIKLVNSTLTKTEVKPELTPELMSQTNDYVWNSYSQDSHSQQNLQTSQLISQNINFQSATNTNIPSQFIFETTPTTTPYIIYNAFSSLLIITNIFSILAFFDLFTAFWITSVIFIGLIYKIFLVFFTKYLVYTDQIIAKFTFFSSQATRIFTNRVISISFHKTFIDNFFNTISISIDSLGASMNKVNLIVIPNYFIDTISNLFNIENESKNTIPIEHQSTFTRAIKTFIIYILNLSRLLIAVVVIFGIWQIIVFFNFDKQILAFIGEPYRIVALSLFGIGTIISTIIVFTNTAIYSTFMKVFYSPDFLINLLDTKLISNIVYSKRVFIKSIEFIKYPILGYVNANVNYFGADIAITKDSEGKEQRTIIQKSTSIPFPANINQIIEQLLLVRADEPPLYDASPNLLSFSTFRIFEIIILPLYLYNLIFALFTKYIFTDNYLIIKHGIIIKRTTILPYKNITYVNINQSVFDRIFKTGTIYISTSNLGVSDVILENIDNYDEIFAFLNQKRLNKQKWTDFIIF